MFLVLVVAVSLAGCIVFDRPSNDSEDDDNDCQITECEELQRHPNSCKYLDDELEIQIRRTSVRLSDNVEFSNVWVEAYYGTFDGGSVVIMGRALQGDADTGIFYGEEEIGGIMFYFVLRDGARNNPIIVWRDDNFLTLRESYEKEFLTVRELGIVAEQHNLAFN